MAKWKEPQSNNFWFGFNDTRRKASQSDKVGNIVAEILYVMFPQTIYVSLFVGVSRSSPYITFDLTCNGVLSEERAVNPTISLKNNVTSSKFSASTGRPLFN